MGTFYYYSMADYGPEEAARRNRDRISKLQRQERRKARGILLPWEESTTPTTPTTEKEEGT